MRGFYGGCLAVLAFLALPGCATQKAMSGSCEPRVEVQRVEVNMPTMPSVDGNWLNGEPLPAAPAWVAPADPAATSALTPAGEQSLRAYIAELFRREERWRLWYRAHADADADADADEAKP